MPIKPILFNTEMVRAILEGRKTQTRRIAFKHDDLREFRSKAYPDGWWYDGRVFKSFENFLHYYEFLHYPQRKCTPDDILWVRETYCENKNPYSKNFGRYEYRADYDEAVCRDLIKWRPPHSMPRKAARIFLRVKDVRVERLNSMSEEDAISEGFADSPAGTDSPLERFTVSWDKIIKREDLREYGWYANPWVWVIEFERCEKPEGWCE